MSNEADLITRLGYIISVTKSVHTGDTQQRKISLMFEHAEKAIVLARDIQVERDNLRVLVDRAGSVMMFHNARCDLHPLSNYSGHEEHLGEYKKVVEEIQALPKEDTDENS